MYSKESDSDDEYPWIEAAHRPPSPKPKKKRDPNKKPKDLNKGPIPMAYKVRHAEDGTKWHSMVDILRPNSPPVEWPEYPDRPLEDDLPSDFDWNEVSDWDLEDPEFVMRKLGIPETEKFIIRNSKKPKMPKKLQKFEEQLIMESAEDLLAQSSLPCATGFVPENPELIDDDNLFQDDDKSVVMFRHTGYGGGLADKPPEPPEDDYYPRDEQQREDVGFDSGELSSGDYSVDRNQMWKDLQEL